MGVIAEGLVVRASGAWASATETRRVGVSSG
jgi:hypothetical protein